MFSIDARQLCYIKDYDAAVKHFNGTPKPRSDAWDDNERPLKDARSTHFLMRKVSNSSYELVLYRTAIVTWYDENNAAIDLTHNSVSTRKFADRFLPTGACYTEKGQTIFQLNGIKYNAGKAPISLRKEGSKWFVVGDVPLMTRKVLDPDKAAEIRAVMKPFKEWVHALWAISGGDGHHPWVGQRVSWRHPLRLSDLKEENYPDFVLRFCTSHYSSALNHNACSHMPAKDFIAKVAKKLREDCYIDIPYTAPLPKRTTPK